MQISAMGIGWYERDDYPRILQIMEDGNKLPRTYENFLTAAERGELEMRQRGHVVVRAMIRSDAFLTYCGDRRMRPNAQARTQFGAEVARDFVMKKQASG